MGTGALLGLVACLLGLWLVPRGRRYGRLFADEHWREVARGMVHVKQAALARIIHTEEDEPNAPGDPRILTTSAGLAVAYTVSERLGGFVHHISVSVVGGPTAHALGGTFTLYAATLLGLPLVELRCSVAESTVHHAEVTLDAARHAVCAAARVLDVSFNEMAALRREVLEARSRVHWQRLSSESEQE